MYKIQILKNLLLIFFLFVSSEFFLQENKQKDTTINNQKLVGINVDFEFTENLDFPKFIEVEKDTFKYKVISLDTTKKISFSKEQVDLDIKFEETVKANYQESSLFANEANYSNSESYLSISGDVKIKDIRGEIFADNLFFDLKNQTVDIKSSSKNNVKANIKVNEKKF